MLCPGSRSGPLALAAAGLQHAGLITLSTAIDERSAGFHALGRSSASGVATAVITTSGTAVANQSEFGGVDSSVFASMPVSLKALGEQRFASTSAQAIT